MVHQLTSQFFYVAYVRSIGSSTDTVKLKYRNEKVDFLDRHYWK